MRYKLSNIKSIKINRFIANLLFFAFFIYLIPYETRAQSEKIRIEKFQGMSVCSGRVFLTGPLISNDEVNKLSSLLNQKTGAFSISSPIVIEPINNNLSIVRSTTSRISTKRLIELLEATNIRNKLLSKEKDSEQKYFIEPDYVISADGEPTNATFTGNWWMEKIGVDKLWASEIKGNTETVVAVLDTGVKLKKTPLSIWQTKQNYSVETDNKLQMCIGGQGFNYRPTPNNYCAPEDTNGHGTNVAGIIGANGQVVKGVSWNVTILPVKVLDDQNRLGCLCDAVRGIKSVIYAKKQLGVNIRVINNSYGTVNTRIPIDRITSLKSVIAEAAQADILMIASAGNGGVNISEMGNEHYPASIEADNLITVAATTIGDKKLESSNYINTAFGAPGENIRTIGLMGENDVISDTSAATPFVSGAAALLFSQCPALTYDEVKSALLKTGEDKTNSLRQLFKYGRLNVFAAYQEIRKNPKCSFLKPVAFNGIYDSRISENLILHGWVQ